MASAGLAGVSGAACPLMRLVTMSSVPILQQLHLEEQLLRCTPDNWCIINDGTAPATIVMGVSGYKLNSSRILSGRMIQSCISPLVDLLIWFCVMQESVGACRDTACPQGPGAGRQEVQWLWHRHC